VNTGDDKPYSLFLASGIPFEVTDTPASDGWTFLSDFDAIDVLSGQAEIKRNQFLYGSNARIKPEWVEICSRKSKGDLLHLNMNYPKLIGTPYVEEDKPVVCAWYL